jgi:hypothetical protein
MVVAILTATVFALSVLAEWLHLRRTRRLAGLAFGPSRRPTLLGGVSPLLRVLSQTGLAWGWRCS